jgi:NAD(P)-dependent dehydrogenase (short-subunit alcohol dehydrogenase family)
MGDRLAGKRVLIYAGATGIGYGCGEAMAKEGARLFISGRREHRLREAAEKLRRLQPTGFAAGDATQQADVVRVTETAVAGMGGLDAVVISAGMSAVASIEEETLENFRFILDANLVSTFLASKAAVPHLKASGGGAIIAIASVLGLVGGRQRVSYSAAKAGVMGLVRSMALDLAEDKIRVNAICPGFVETELSLEIISREREPEKLLEARRRGNPMGRAGLASEIGAMAVYLAADESAWTTGQSLTVDGGFTIR